jgi:hypothetical protein
MTHPEELLAPYVDGTASTEERAAVDAHVLSCARCRAEIAASTAARTELKRLPVVDAPPGLIPDVIGTATGPQQAGPPGWYRWGGTAAVAAVIVLLLALVLPKIGAGTSNDSSGRAAVGAEATTQPSQIPIEIQAVDYRGDALRSALTSYAAADRGSPSAAELASPGMFAPQANAKTGTPQQAAAAQACIQEAFQHVPGTLVRLISARFEGTRAYIGIYEEGPGAGQPPDMLVARVASTGTCTPLSLAQARLGP